MKPLVAALLMAFAGAAFARTHTVGGTVKWPRMTMVFKPEDRALLHTLKPGQKIEFDFEQRGRDYVITRLK